MYEKETIQEIKKVIVDLKNKGHQSMSVDVFISYLDEFENNIGNYNNFSRNKFESQLALHRAEHERNLAHYDAQQQHALEMLRAVIGYGQAALKSALLINGGAAAALLAFIGNIWAKGITAAAVVPLTNSIVFFAFGVLSAALGTGTTYVTQYCYLEKLEKKRKSIPFNHTCSSFIELFFIRKRRVRKLFNFCLSFNEIKNRKKQWAFS